MRDGLTGMFNRRYAEERLNEEFDRAIRYGRDFSLIFMDLDHFKFFNDLNGHQAGDELLQTLATLMTQAVRESDTLARWGGEEFVVVTPETDQEGAYILAERIRKSVAEYSFPNAAQQPLGLVSLSIGVASISIGVESCAKLIGCADDAMYSAKSAGRNRTVVCSSPGKMDHAESPADSKET